MLIEFFKLVVMVFTTIKLPHEAPLKSDQLLKFKSPLLLSPVYNKNMGAFAIIISNAILGKYYLCLEKKTFCCFIMERG